MTIEYSTSRTFTAAQVEDLFLSISWHSGKFPNRLFKSLQASSLVITAWEGNQLVGLVRALDDGCMTAFMHYLLVRPSHQGKGIASHLVQMVKEHYSYYLYINIMPEESKNATFYQKHGFELMTDGVAMQIKHDIKDVI